MQIPRPLAPEARQIVNMAIEKKRKNLNCGLPDEEFSDILDRIVYQASQCETSLRWWYEMPEYSMTKKWFGLYWNFVLPRKHSQLIEKLKALGYEVELEVTKFMYSYKITVSW